jgi:hypothetical protein
MYRQFSGADTVTVMDDSGSASSEHTGWERVLWNRAKRRGFTREEFDAEAERARTDSQAAFEFHKRLGLHDGPDVPMPDPYMADQPDWMFDYGWPGHVLDEHGSVDGCHWND